MRAIPLLLVALLLWAGPAWSQGNELVFGFDTTLDFDSNVRGKEDGSDPDLRWRMAPSLTANGDLDRLRYQSYWRSSYRMHAINGSRDRWTHAIRANSIYDLSPRSTISVWQGFRSLEVDASFEDDDEDRDRKTLNDYVIDGGLRFTRYYTPRVYTETQVGYQVYEQEDKRDYDVRAYFGSFSMKYKPTRRDNFSLNAEYEFDDIIAPEIASVDDDASSKSHQGRAVVRWVHEFSRTLSLELRGGPTVAHDTAKPVESVRAYALVFGPSDVPNFQNNTDGEIDYFFSRRPYSAFDRRENFDPESQPPTSLNRLRTKDPLIYSPSLDDCKTVFDGVIPYRDFSRCTSEVFSGGDNRDSIYVVPGYLYDDRDDGRLVGVDVRAGRNLPTGEEFILYDYDDAELDQNGEDFWRADFKNNTDSPYNQQILDLPDGWNLGQVNVGYMPGEKPGGFKDTRLSFVAEIALKQQWRNWNGELSYSRRENPDVNAGGGTAVDHVIGLMRWKPRPRWRVAFRTSWRRRTSVNKSPATYLVAGALGRRTDSGGVELVYARPLSDPFYSGGFIGGNDPEAPEQSPRLLPAEGAPPPDNPENLSLIPVAIGLVDGKKRRAIDVNAFRLGTTIQYQLTERSNVRFETMYRHQVSEGRGYRTYDRFVASISFNFKYDPFRF